MICQTSAKKGEKDVNKKRILAGVILAALAVSTGGCGPTIYVKTNERSQESQTVPESVVSETVNENVGEIKPARLPEEFYLIYEVETDEGTIETYSLAKDLDGNIYYKDPDKEGLFVKEGSAYLLYQKDEMGQMSVSEQRKYQESYVEDYTENIMEYVDQGNIAVSGNALYEGTCEVAGRNCNEYSITLDIGNFTQEFAFASDNATGVCLKWENNKNISGFDVSEGGSFYCTRYETSGISLNMTDL